MGILIIAGILIFVIFAIYLINAQKKEEDAEAIAKAADVFRRMGYGDKKAITKEWEYMKKAERKWIMCEACEKVQNEFTMNGNTEALHFLLYCVGDEIVKCLEELRDFYEKADEEARNRWG